MCGNHDVNAVAWMIDRANDWGYDAIEIGVVLAMYMEYSQRGYANGDGLAWGDTHGMAEVMRKIAFREGIGDILAEGPERRQRSWDILSLRWRARIRASRPTIRAASRAWASATPPQTAALAICAATPRLPRWSATC